MLIIFDKFQRAKIKKKKMHPVSRHFILSSINHCQSNFDPENIPTILFFSSNSIYWMQKLIKHVCDLEIYKQWTLAAILRHVSI